MKYTHIIHYPHYTSTIVESKNIINVLLAVLLQYTVILESICEGSGSTDRILYRLSKICKWGGTFSVFVFQNLTQVSEDHSATVAQALYA